MSIANEITRLQNAKIALKASIVNKGVEVADTDLIDTYASKVDSISTGGGDYTQVDMDRNTFFPPVNSTTIKYLSGTTEKTTAIATNDNVCGILDEDKVEWTLADWNARWFNNGCVVDSSWAKPIGMWFQANNLHYALLWHYTGTTYDICGVSKFADTMRHSPYEYTLISATASGTDYATGKAWSVVADGDNFVLKNDNTGVDFTIPKNTGTVYNMINDNIVNLTDTIYYQSEWLRHRFAIDSGFETTEADGTITSVEILNSSGSQPAVGEDMYFWIGGVNTSKLAKYNLNNRHAVNSAYLTQTYADAIYAKQIAKGINMNDTGVNSATYPILPSGSKGAEAIAVGGKWLIITPFLSRVGTTYTGDYYIPDSPAVYYVKNVEKYLPCTKMLFFYWTRKSYISGILNYLRTYEKWTMASALSGYCWCAERLISTYAWYVNLGIGSVGNVTTYIGYYVCPSLAL